MSPKACQPNTGVLGEANSNNANGNNTATPPMQMVAKRAVEPKGLCHFFCSKAYAAHAMDAAFFLGKIEFINPNGVVAKAYADATKAEIANLVANDPAGRHEFVGSGIPARYWSPSRIVLSDSFVTVYRMPPSAPPIR